MIDVWDFATYDEEIHERLRSGTDTIRGFREHRQRVDREAAHRARYAVMAENPYALGHDVLEAQVAELLRTRTIRAFHYTRMTDREVDLIRRGGFQPTSLELLRRRLDGQVSEGNLRQEDAEAIYASSPLQSGAYGNRLDMFWMTATPIPVLDGGVELLVGSWGGESAYWCVDDEVGRILQTIGRGRVFELAVDMQQARDWAPTMAANIAIDLYAATIGFKPRDVRMDLYAGTPIEAERILRVHSDGESAYAEWGTRIEA